MKTMITERYSMHNKNSQCIIHKCITIKVIFYNKNLDIGNFAKGQNPHRVESGTGKFHVANQHASPPNHPVVNHEKEEWMRKQSDLQRENKNLHVKNESLQREIEFLQSQKDDLLNDQSMIRENTENVLRQQINDGNHKVLSYKKDQMDADLRSKE